MCSLEFVSHGENWLAGQLLKGVIAVMDSMSLSEPVPVNATGHMSCICTEWMLSPLRRIFDFCGAALALIGLSPVFVIIAIAVHRSSPGPVLFRQRRMGRDGRTFVLYKFRSMQPGHDGSAITILGDPRITHIGARLRRHKLDELPQLWNVLKGDMSLVGPRPKLPHHEALRLPCRPGITGAASLAFRDEEALLSGLPGAELEEIYERDVKPAKARLDLEYLRSATVTSDLKMIWMTAVSCLCVSKEMEVFHEGHRRDFAFIPFRGDAD